MSVLEVWLPIKDQNKKRVLTAGKEDAGDTDYSTSNLVAWLDKLHALQFRVLDLQGITAEKEIRKQ
mgnify:CR=1 FL=1